MRLVLIESPYAGMIGRNIVYALDCVADSLARGEAPFASHLLYPRVIRDDDEADRARGIAAGLAWGQAADATVVYTDHGISEGMRIGIAAALAGGRAIEWRKLR